MQDASGRTGEPARQPRRVSTNLESHRCASAYERTNAVATGHLPVHLFSVSVSAGSPSSADPSAWFCSTRDAVVIRQRNKIATGGSRGRGSRPRRRGRPAVGPRTDGPAATKKRPRPRRLVSASASWPTSLVGVVRERGGPRPVRWKTGAGPVEPRDVRAHGRGEAPVGRSPVDMEVRREARMGVAAIISRRSALPSSRHCWRAHLALTRADRGGIAAAARPADERRADAPPWRCGASAEGGLDAARPGQGTRQPCKEQRVGAGGGPTPSLDRRK